MRDFVDAHRGTFGVEPICKVLRIALSGYRRYAAQQRDPGLRSARARRDDELAPQIKRVWQVNMQVYGAIRSGASWPVRALSSRDALSNG
jgi:hypothetical protein